MRRHVFVLLCSLILSVQADGLLTQPLGISGRFLTTSIGIGQPAQYFDLAIILTSDETTVLDANTQNLNLDYKYDYLKGLFFPISSNSANVTQMICRQTYLDANNKKQSSDGHYVVDTITFTNTAYLTPVRFCDLDTERTATSTYDDPLNWLMVLPIDGFLGLKPGGENILKKLVPKGSPFYLTLYVNKNAIEPDSAGMITFGMDTTNCGTFKPFPSEDSDTFSAWVTGTSFNGVGESVTYTALFDLTYNGLVVPKDVYDDIAYYFNNQPTSFSCTSSQYSNPPDLVVNFYGASYSISIKELVVDTDNDGRCRVLMKQAASTDEYQFVFGRSILNKYCLFLDYDNARIGLSETR